MQSVHEFLSVWKSQHKWTAKVLETRSSVNDMYHHNGPSSLHENLSVQHPKFKNTSVGSFQDKLRFHIQATTR